MQLRMKQIVLFLFLCSLVQAACLEPNEVNIPLEVNLPVDFNIPVIAYRITKPNEPVALELPFCDTEGDISVMLGAGVPANIIVEPNDWLNVQKYLQTQTTYRIQANWNAASEGLVDIFTYAFADYRNPVPVKWYAICVYHEVQPNDTPMPQTPIDIVPFGN